MILHGATVVRRLKTSYKNWKKERPGLSLKVNMVLSNLMHVLLKNLRWLNVQQLTDLDTASMVHRAINNGTPYYF